MLRSHRLRNIAIASAGVFLLYLLLGFFVVPVLLKHVLITHVQEKLHHRLLLGDMRFNPLSFTLEVNELELQEANGAWLLGCKRLFANFQATSVFTRAWRFAELTLEAPRLNLERRKDGTHNFGRLLEALHDPNAPPTSELPPLKVDAIRLTDGRIDIADLTAGDAARLRIAPIGLDLTDLSTLVGEKGPYKITARTKDAETVSWEGTISLNPIASSARVAFANWKLSTFARMLGSRISVENAAGTLHADLKYTVAFNAGKLSARVNEFELRGSGLAVTPKGNSQPAFAADSVELGGGEFSLNERTAAVQRLAMDKTRIAIERGADGALNLNAMLLGHTTPSDPTVATTPTEEQARPASAPPGAGWRFELKELALTDLGLRYSDRREASPSAMSLQGLGLRLGATVEFGVDGANLSVAGVKATVPGLELTQGTQILKAEALELGVGALKSRFHAQNAELDLEQLQVGSSTIGARTPQSQYAVRNLVIGSQTLTAEVRGGDAPSQRCTFDNLRVDTDGLKVGTASAKHDVLEAKRFALQSKALTFANDGNDQDATVAALSATLSTFAVRDPASGAALAQLERAEVAGGSIGLRDRRATLDRVTLTNGRAVARMSTNGGLDWDAVLKAFAAAPTPAVSSLPKPKAPTSGGWKALVKTLELRNFAGAFSDHRSTPTLDASVQGVNAVARNLSSDRNSAAQVDLSGRINETAQFAVQGSVNPHTFETEVKVSASNLSLTPLEPFISRIARLHVVSGLASASGRLRYGVAKGTAAELVYEGELGLEKVNIEETEPTLPFVALDSAKASEVKLTLWPNRLDVGELRLSGFSGRLLIAEDQSVNLTKVLRAPPAAAGSPPESAQTRNAPSGAGDFPISIARIRVERSRLEFSDLSLRPPFATKMHELKGVINGVATAPGSRAQAELDARVDEFGSARIRGEMNLFKPRDFTDVDMRFHNLEMTTMTPYSAKFAGYRIASGKLSMDLRYRVKNGALVGENKLLLDKLELGERVESPSALNLPLELAIAILKDSDGKIDIGLPVSGSLDDPQFSYAQLIWKAIGNLLTRIVTAPFRALASLFGGGSEKLDAIVFEPGTDRLLPPERQKLRTVAEALAKRPQLKLTVKPTYAAGLDRSAIQVAAIRRQVLTRAGVKIAPDEEPGPIDFTNTRTQQAIDALFVGRYDAPAARDLRARIAKSASAAKNAQPETKSGTPIAAEVARAMVRQLVDAQTVAESDLVGLAKRRGDAIVQELRSAGKLDAARLAAAPPGAAENASADGVATVLDLGVAKSAQR